MPNPLNALFAGRTAGAALQTLALVIAMLLVGYGLAHPRQAGLPIAFEVFVAVADAEGAVPAAVRAAPAGCAPDAVAPGACAAF